MLLKQTIVIDARMINSSGIGTYLKNVIGLLPPEFELTLLGHPEELSDINKAAKIIEFRSPIYSTTEQLKYPKLIPRCDVFWSPHYNVPLLPIKAKKRVVTIHDVFHLAFMDTLSVKQKIYAKTLFNRAVKASDKVITVSNFSKKEIIRYTKCSNDKIQVIHNGVNTVQPSVIADAKEKYRLPDKYILFIGNVKPHKNLIGLLKAYTLLSADLKKEYKLVIAGKKEGFITGDDEPLKLINSTPDLEEKVIFTGFVEDKYVNELYTKASLFVFPSFYEGFGLPPLEAMSNRCPVIVSAIDIMFEVCGDAALYFDPFSPADISEKIAKIIVDKTLITELNLKSAAQIKNFKWQDAANKHIDVFNNLIGH